jgi:hypothetical protein
MKSSPCACDTIFWGLSSDAAAVLKYDLTLCRRLEAFPT